MLGIANSISVAVSGPDGVGEARRQGNAIAAAIGLDETAAGQIALVATECASNLWKHGGGGEMLFTPLAEDAGLEMLALDKGDGMRNVDRCFQDGYSTAGSPGTGLGAIRRLSAEYDLYTVPGKGTALLARIRKRRPHARHARFETGAVCVPLPGEDTCGDGYAVAEHRDGAVAMMVDGLGHGPAAADCALAARGAFAAAGTHATPIEMLREIHAALRPTRGAAVAVARIDAERREVRFAGIGNIAAVIYSGEEARQMASLPGIAGHDIRNVKEFTYAWPPNALALLYSDGIATHWSMNSYEGLLSRDPSVIAGVLYRDHKRGRDDATILAVREVNGP